MLSRVAAVKAPRTHNRRRVTGSSGRRREGRESEPQRPNMSRRVFTSAVLLLLVMMCCRTAAASAEEPSKRKFVWRDVKGGEGTVSSLRVPSLLKVGNDVFAVAEAQDMKKEEGDFTGIASELLEWTGEETRKELDKTKLKAQVLEKCSSDKGKCASQIVAQASLEEGKKVYVARPTTVLQRSDIYMLAGIYNLDAADNTSAYWGLLLSRGNVSVDEKSKKRIHWNHIDDIQSISKMQKEESLTDLIGGGGSGVKMNDGTLVFPVEGIKSNGAAGVTDTVSLVIYSLKDAASWKLSKGMSADGCSDPSVVEWEKGKKLMMMTACDDGRRRVYESVDKGESWTEALGTLSRVWGNRHTGPEKGVGSGLITAKIDNRDVMLVTLPVYSKEKKKEEKEKGELHLWLTDNTHIVDIGPVSEKDEDVTASSLLYESGDNNNENLIALYEKGDEKDKSLGMVSVRLTAQLEKVKDVLKTWKEVDERVSQLCTTLRAQKVASTHSPCTTDKITDGLVGFLSDNFSDDTWSDEYLGVNATVKANGGAAKADNGVQFTGRGAGAEWPVGSQGENQLYHFANYNFTLVATVSIDGVPKEGSPIPLMGVRADSNGGKKLMELSYDNGKKWVLLCGDETPKEHSSTWEKEKTQHVVLLIRNGNQGTAYVDGQRVGGDEQCELKTKASKEISHFYIGGDGDKTGRQEGVSVTVTNVLLYNRPLDSTELDAFNPNKAPISPQVPENAQGTLLQSSAGQPLSDPKLLNENKGVGGGSASTSAPSTVTTSLGKEQSTIQLSSETSPGGKKNVDGGSSSNDDQTAEAEAGDTVPGDGPPQTPAGTPATADANTPTATGKRKVEPAVTTGVSASSGEDGETAGGTDAQGEEGIHSQDREVNATALNSSLGNLSQGNNSDGGTMHGNGLLPSLLLLLGLWGFAAR
ncbi:trans-sialidase [Trypanosoma cruzi cruzi]|uniref:Putative trans-sialidase, Group V n=1 Tax=Trypanosoma cruzi TaxID=5693 RepID=A0A2V2UYF8_TRYCR|nr:trans-sialidase [Trypanosoma cruzi cruzi]PWU88222.1 putative trans-sialidase, Group V [Trypanosoma cruzi]